LAKTPRQRRRRRRTCSDAIADGYDRILPFADEGRHFRPADAHQHVDFATVRQALAAQGRQLATTRSVHVTFLDGDELTPTCNGLTPRACRFLKSVDNAEPVYKAQELMKASGVLHMLVYRSTKYDVPDYDLTRSWPPSNTGN
jgi:hypothetical protein